MPYTKSRSSRSFTMVEMAIATAMVGLIGLALAGVFANASRIFQRASKPLAAEDLQIFLTHFETDVRNSMAFSGIRFIGSEEHLELATLVYSQRLGTASVGKAAYSFDSQGNFFTRQQLDFSQIYAQDEVMPAQVLKGVQSATVSYYTYDPLKKTYVWLPQWNRDGLPRAIRLELEIGDDASLTKFTKTVSIPRAT